jgi:hypothetical protein
VFTYAALRLGLYLYGDLFVVRWKRGSFPAAFKNIITALVIVVVALVLLKKIMDINVTSLIATITVLTATIGLAFQSTLSNMLAGLTIHLEKPLKQGDWISVAGHEGRVMDISLRSTRIMTSEHNEAFIPNSKVLSEAAVTVSVKTYASGEIPVQQGGPGNSFYIIKGGRVDVVVEKSSREKAVVATLGPGNFFGEMSLLTGAVRTASIQVKNDAEFIDGDNDPVGKRRTVFYYRWSGQDLPGIS